MCTFEDYYKRGIPCRVDTPLTFLGLLSVYLNPFFLFLSLFFVYTIYVDPAIARDVILSDDARICLGCHAKRGIVKKFQNGEAVAAYVDIEKFKASVHNFLACSGCHADFSSDNHPTRRFRSRKQYQIKSSLVCRHCHTDEQIKGKPIHASLLRGGE